jgi:hypothetical protein
MVEKTDDVIFGNRVFAWVAIATGLILLVPLVAMQFTAEVNWDETDFIVMGLLLFGMGSAFVLAARKVPRKYRLPIGSLFVVAFVYIWAELAVGVFTNLGS